MFYTARVPTIQQLPANERDNLRNAVPEYYQQLAAIKIGISYQRSDGNRDLLSFARLHDTQCSLPVRQMPATWIPVINAKKAETEFKNRHDSNLHAIESFFYNTSCFIRDAGNDLMRDCLLLLRTRPPLPPLPPPLPPLS